jgi:hypothetical protein
MASKLDRDLRIPSFVPWLVREGRSPATAVNYVKHVRLVLVTEENAQAMLADPEGAKKRILQHEASLGSGYRGPFRSAMRAFDRFLASRGGPSICPSFPDRRRVGTPELPHPIAPYILALVRESRMPWRTIEGLKWDHVSAGYGAKLLRIDDPVTKEFYKASFDTLRQLNSWAGGGSPVRDLNIPLVPTEPLSLFPMSTARLRALARSAMPEDRE